MVALVSRVARTPAFGVRGFFLGFLGPWISRGPQKRGSALPGFPGKSTSLRGPGNPTTTALTSYLDIGKTYISVEIVFGQLCNDIYILVGAKKRKP